MHALIATDGSPVSLEAARKGCAILNPDKVTLVTVADTSIAEDSGAGGFEGNLLSVEESRDVRGVIIETGQEELSDTVKALGLDPTIVETKLLEGSPGPVICAAAEEFNPDVVVVGSHGRGWFQRLVIGSISEYVARHCLSPVLIVRAGDNDG
ncbi:MAG: universal stress protein [Microthrixaceae bacterium]|nr:universal stress protein [Microthrixaceae bacterium]